MSDQLLPFPWFDLILILVLVAINGLLSMSELAIVSARTVPRSVVRRPFSICVTVVRS